MFIYLMIQLFKVIYVIGLFIDVTDSEFSRISVPSGSCSRPRPRKQNKWTVVSASRNFQVLQTVNSEHLGTTYLAKSPANRPNGAGRLAFQPCAAGRKCLEVQTVQSAISSLPEISELATTWENDGNGMKWLNVVECQLRGLERGKGLPRHEHW